MAMRPVILYSFSTMSGGGEILLRVYLDSFFTIWGD